VTQAILNYARTNKISDGRELLGQILPLLEAIRNDRHIKESHDLENIDTSLVEKILKRKDFQSILKPNGHGDKN